MSFPSLNSESVTSGKLLTQYFYPQKMKRRVFFYSSLLLLLRFRSYFVNENTYIGSQKLMMVASSERPQSKENFSLSLD